MRAAVFEAPGKINLTSVPIPEPKDDEVLIRLEGCGVCGSNLALWEGREWFNYPAEPGSPGHEGWGVVEKIGANVAHLRIGDRVTALSYKAFAEFDVAKESEAVKLPHKLSREPFPGEPIGCAVNIVERSDIKKGQFTAVIGIGFIGALLVPLLKLKGAKVIAITRRESALEQARQYGADFLIKMDDHWKVVDTVKEITNGAMCSRVIEAAGYQWPLDLAGDLTNERGKLIIAGYHQDGPRQVNMQMWNWKGLDVINAHERDPKNYIKGIKKGVELTAHGKLDPSLLYTDEVNLSNLKDAFKKMEERPAGFMKGLLII